MHSKGWLTLMRRSGKTLWHHRTVQPDWSEFLPDSYQICQFELTNPEKSEALCSLINNQFIHSNWLKIKQKHSVVCINKSIVCKNRVCLCSEACVELWHLFDGQLRSVLSSVSSTNCAFVFAVCSVFLKLFRALQCAINKFQNVLEFVMDLACDFEKRIFR